VRGDARMAVEEDSDGQEEVRWQRPCLAGLGTKGLVDADDTRLAEDAQELTGQQSDYFA
jgi:hypothetical protein